MHVAKQQPNDLKIEGKFHFYGYSNGIKILGGGYKFLQISRISLLNLYWTHLSSNKSNAVFTIHIAIPLLECCYPAQNANAFSINDCQKFSLHNVDEYKSEYINICRYPPGWSSSSSRGLIFVSSQTELLHEMAATKCQLALWVMDHCC